MDNSALKRSLPTQRASARGREVVRGNGPRSEAIDLPEAKPGTEPRFPLVLVETSLPSPSLYPI